MISVWFLGDFRAFFSHFWNFQSQWVRFHMHSQLEPSDGNKLGWVCFMTWICFETLYVDVFSFGFDSVGLRIKFG